MEFNDLYAVKNEFIFSVKLKLFFVELRLVVLTLLGLTNSELNPIILLSVKLKNFF
jgi:hypothetical protein